MSDFPRSVNAITPEWLTTVPRESDATRAAHVASFALQNIGDAPDVAVVTRATLEYGKSGVLGPKTVIVKQALTDETGRAATSPLNRAETCFHTEFNQVSRDIKSSEYRFDRLVS